MLNHPEFILGAFSQYMNMGPVVPDTPMPDLGYDHPLFTQWKQDMHSNFTGGVKKLHDGWMGSYFDKEDDTTNNENV